MKKITYHLHRNIVLYKYKAIYFFIPKVACTSLKKVCADLLNIKLVKRYVGVKKVLKKEDVWERDSLFHEIDFPYLKKNEISTIYKDYFKFCFVRNPWDRMVSCYNNKITFNNNLNNSQFRKGISGRFSKYKGFKAGMSFEEFVCSIKNIPDTKSEELFKSQYLTITDEKRNLLVDFIGKFERLDKDFSYVCKRIGLPDIKLPYLMKSKHKHYRKYYSNKTQEIVRRRYKKDIDMFSYKF
jgi:hypothetical protein